METVVSAIVSLGVGIFVGVISGLLGIGGGTILVPTFRLGYLMEPIACTATSLFTIIPTSFTGALTHLRNKSCIPKLGIAAGLGGALTSPVGVWLASVSPSWAIMAATAVIIMYSAYTMLKKALQLKPERTRRATDGAHVAEPDADAPPSIPDFGIRRLAMGVGIGLAAGLASGYVGVGGGFFMVPMMIQLFHVPMKLTSGTSLIAVMILAVPGVVYQAILGNINWIAGIAVACGSIPGAVLGARLVPVIPERTLRFTFSGFLMVTAVLLIINQG